MKWTPVWLLLTTPCLSAAEVRLSDRVFTFPDDYTLQVVAAPPLVDRPIEADSGDDGALYVTESSGSNAPVTEQVKTRPHRVLRLTDRDGDGVYDTRTVFADGFMFPEGCLWHDGSLYVAAPPQIWKLTDADGDGVAERREVWFDGKTLTGCANDLHGPYRGPDGLIYWCKGAFAEQTHDLPGQPAWKSRASHVFRARAGEHGPEGLECVFTAGMDNPVGLAWTPEGDLIVSGTFFQHPGDGKRDGLIHAVPGGVWGKDHDVLAGHPRTGGLMPPMTHLGPAAPCGLIRYGRDLLCAQFNLRKVSRHVLEPSGATWHTVDSDFLSCDHPDFHPTDVLQAPDGSVLVIDTGGWYKLCCPTSQLAKPDVLGAIYRLRRKGGEVPVTVPPPQVPEAHAKRRALEAAARPGAVAEVPAVFTALSAAGDDRFLFHASAWALLQIGDSASARAGLAHASPSVRAACLYALEQMKAGGLAAADVVPQLALNDDRLREAVLFAFSRHGDWAPALEPWLRRELATPDAGGEPLARVLSAVATPSFLGGALGEAGTEAARRAILTAMSSRGLKSVPEPWREPLRAVVGAGNEDALRLIRSLGEADRQTFAHALAPVVADGSQALTSRLLALAAMPAGPVDDATFALIRRHLDAAASAGALDARKWNSAQLRELAQAFPAVGVLARAAVLACFSGCEDESVGHALVEALVTSGALVSTPRETVETACAHFPAAVREALETALVKAKPADQAARLDQLEKSLPAGDAARGVIVFQSAKASCVTCHPVGYKGGHFGPDLSKVGAVRTRRDLLESIVFPSASFVRSYEPVQVTRRDGTLVLGLVVNEGADFLSLATAPAAPVARVLRSDIASLTPASLSLMPQGFDQILTPQELADILAYLETRR